MQLSSLLTVAILLSLSTANPLPSSVNTPISDAEWSSLRDGGLGSRDAGPGTLNQPISESEWQALQDGGLSRRENKKVLVARDKVMNCGHLITGKGGSDGHGKWVPVADFVEAADRFCRGYTGTDIYKGLETSDTYPIFLTNQKDDTQRGPAGNIVFAIYNTERADTYLVNYYTCLSAMKAPLGNHVSRRDGLVTLAKRDNCYGSKHSDYEGGYYKIDGIGAFGSEVYAA